MTYAVSRRTICRLDLNQSRNMYAGIGKIDIKGLWKEREKVVL